MIDESSEIKVEENPDELLDTSWPDPMPLVHEDLVPAPYPAEALPSLIQNAVIDYHQYGQQPLPLIACSALANVSLSCQTLANVARDRVLSSPVSLYFLVCASSGERKSAADKIFGQAIRQWEIKVREKLSPEIQVAKTLHRAWIAEKEGLLSQIRRSALMGEDPYFLKQQLVAVMDEEPEVPMLPMLFFEDATGEALSSHMAHGWPSASIWSDEGGIVLGGAGMQSNATKFVAMLNRLWDGNPFIAHRKTSQSYTVSNRRLTISIMLQPLILEQMLSKGGGINRQSGFMARTLMAYPTSSIGGRYYQEPPESLESLIRFNARLQDRLESSLSMNQQGCHEIPSLILSPEAKACWVSFFNRIESDLSKKWFSIKDFASKAAENAARLSALFHLFERKEGLISQESMERAIPIITWHLLEAKRVLGNEFFSPLHQQAIKLLKWLCSKQITQTTPRTIQQFGPLKHKEDRDSAIELLIQKHYLRQGKEDGKTVLWVNPKA